MSDLKKNLASQWIAQFYVGLVSFMLNIYLARFLTPSVYGKYFVALVVGGLILILLDGGFRTVLMRESVSTTNGKTYTVQSLLKMANGNAIIVSFILFLVASVFLPGELLLASALIFCFFMQAILQFTISINRGRGLFVQDAIIQIFVRTVSVIVIVVALEFGFAEPWNIFFFWGVGTLIALGAASGVVTYPPIRSVSFVRQSGLFSIVSIDLATLIYFRCGIVIMNILSVPDHEIGLYGVASRFIEALIFAFYPISILSFRSFRLCNALNDLSVFKLIRSVTFLSFLFGVFVTGLFYYYSFEIVVLFYGMQYYNSADILRILALVFPFVLTNSVLSQAVLALNLDRFYLTGATYGALFGVSSNLMFVGSFGVVAVAWCLLFTEAFICVYLTMVLYRHFRVNFMHLQGLSRK